MENTHVTNERVNNEKTSLGFIERLAFGTGDLANNIIYAAISTFLLFYYTDVIGVSAAAVGTIMLISRILDCVADLAMGFVVDRTKSKYGKARPWIIRMAIPFAIGGVLLFSVPTTFSENAKLIYIFITYNLVSTIIYTSINVPYATLNALMTQDQYERSVLSIFRMILSTVGSMGIAMFTLPVVKFFGNDARAWTLTFAVFGVLSVALFAFTFFGTKERVKPSNAEQAEENIPIKVGLSVLFKNKYWAMITAILVLIFVGMTLNGGATVYYAQNVLGNKELVGTLSTAMMMTQIACMFLVAGLIKKFGKRNVMIIGSVITASGYLLIALAGTNVQMLIAANVVRGIGAAGIAACMFAMVSDTIEYGEWKTGIRIEGLTNSAASFGFKVGGGLGAAFVGWVLSAGGYVGGAEVQTASAILAVKSLYIYLPLLITVAQIVILFAYKLDKEYPTILKELKERSNSK